MSNVTGCRHPNVDADSRLRSPSPPTMAAATRPPPTRSVAAPGQAATDVADP